MTVCKNRFTIIEILGLVLNIFVIGAVLMFQYLSFPIRGWDQFEANATLFGVKSTFNEELYTTKLEKGPQMRELEKEAMRIAREIEGEDTGDLHLAEVSLSFDHYLLVFSFPSRFPDSFILNHFQQERGRQLDGSVELDEETRFSSVIRSVDDSGYDEIEDILQDSRNDETFGDSLRPVIGKPPIDTFPGKARDGAQMPSRFPSLVISLSNRK